MTFLDIRGVTKRYGVTTAVDDVTLSVAAGSRTAVVGPSGSIGRARTLPRNSAVNPGQDHRKRHRADSEKEKRHVEEMSRVRFCSDLAPALFRHPQRS